MPRADILSINPLLYKMEIVFQTENLALGEKINDVG